MIPLARCGDCGQMRPVWEIRGVADFMPGRCGMCRAEVALADARNLEPLGESGVYRVLRENIPGATPLDRGALFSQIYGLDAGLLFMLQCDAAVYRPAKSRRGKRPEPRPELREYLAQRLGDCVIPADDADWWRAVLQGPARDEVAA